MRLSVFVCVGVASTSGSEHQRLAHLSVIIKMPQSMGSQVTHTGWLIENIANQLFPPQASSSPPSPPEPPHRELPVPPPEPLASDLGKCKGFLLQCSLMFNQQPRTYATDPSKVAYVTGDWFAEGKSPRLDWGAAGEYR